MVPRSIPRPNLTPELKKAEKTGPLSFWNRPKRSNNSRDRAKPGSKKVQHSSKFVILSFAGGSRSQNPTQLSRIGILQEMFCERIFVCFRFVKSTHG